MRVGSVEREGVLARESWGSLGSEAGVLGWGGNLILQISAVRAFTSVRTMPIIISPMRSEAAELGLLVFFPGRRGLGVRACR